MSPPYSYLTSHCGSTITYRFTTISIYISAAKGPMVLSIIMSIGMLASEM